MNNNSVDNSCLLSDQVKEDHQEEYRKHIRSIILIPEDRTEYDRIKDLADTIRYRSKLMAYYGFDVQSGTSRVAITIATLIIMNYRTLV